MGTSASNMPSNSERSLTDPEKKDAYFIFCSENNVKRFDKTAVPVNVTELQFDIYFNQLLYPGMLSKTLHSLRFGYAFNHSLLPGVLPGNLGSLVLGARWNQYLEKNM